MSREIGSTDGKMGRRGFLKLAGAAASELVKQLAREHGMSMVIVKKPQKLKDIETSDSINYPAAS